MSSTLDVLYVAKYAALTGDASLAAIIGARVYDSAAPDGAVFPYIVLGGAGESDGATYESTGGDTAGTDHIWTRAADREPVSREQLHTIWGHMRRIYGTLGAVGGYRVAFSEARLVEVLVDPTDRQVLHGIVRHRAQLEVP